jgi:hypothetical protein
VQTLVHPTWVALWLLFFGIGQQCGYQLKKIAYTYCCLQCMEQISNDIAKYRFQQKNGNNRESKPNHPAHKLVSFRLTNDHFYIP